MEIRIVIDDRAVSVVRSVLARRRTPVAVALLLTLTSAAVFALSSPAPFEEGDTLTADALNTRFDALFSAVAALEAAQQASVVSLDCPHGYLNASDDPAYGFDNVVAQNPDAVLCVRGEDQMVKVGDFWIDRYESVLVDAAWYNGGLCDTPGKRYGNPATCAADACDDYPDGFPDSGQLSSPVYACSVGGFVPSRGMTWFQASIACTLAGKHLVTNEEWQTAAAGTKDPQSSPGTGGTCVTSGDVRATGGGNTCRSWFGADDMVGNLTEWVAMWGQGGQTWMSDDSAVSHPWPSGYSSDDFDTTFNINGTATSVVDYAQGLPYAPRRGGSFHNGTGAGVFSIHANAAPTHFDWSVGARCARR